MLDDQLAAHPDVADVVTPGDVYEVRGDVEARAQFKLVEIDRDQVGCLAFDERADFIIAA